ncbi:IclR family transcriptional regulator [Roseovarius confluentis]|uniref:IclR family transcriptional regulator n=1 Tax=Roseovarius confluentis TaxID=1852027 RepID=UPI000CDCEAA0|nr:IclR family transcriptional regulator [Roseovarius confluentis]
MMKDRKTAASAEADSAASKPKAAPRRDTTLRKGLRLIEILSARGAMSLGDISRVAELSKTNAHHLLHTLIEEGYVEQDPETVRYGATLRLWEVAMMRSEQPDWINPCLPAMQRLRHDSRETVILGLIDGDEVLYLHRLDSPEAVRTFTRVGERAPGYCVATGKAILAFDPDGETRWRALEPVAQSDETITDLDALVEDMKATRDRGYSINRGEWRGGVCAIGAPIYGLNGRVRMALSIAGPADRVTETRIPELAKMVTTAAEEASAALQTRKET